LSFQGTIINMLFRVLDHTKHVLSYQWHCVSRRLLSPYSAHVVPLGFVLEFGMCGSFVLTHVIYAL
jgi:hypothetical protein